jgi:hypothetical protein
MADAAPTPGHDIPDGDPGPREWGKMRIPDNLWDPRSMMGSLKQLRMFLITFEREYLLYPEEAIDIDLMPFEGYITENVDSLDEIITEFVADGKSVPWLINELMVIFTQAVQMIRPPFIAVGREYDLEAYPPWRFYQTCRVIANRDIKTGHVVPPDIVIGRMFDNAVGNRIQIEWVDHFGAFTRINSRLAIAMAQNESPYARRYSSEFTTYDLWNYKSPQKDFGMKPVNEHVGTPDKRVGEIYEQAHSKDLSDLGDLGGELSQYNIGDESAESYDEDFHNAAAEYLVEMDMDAPPLTPKVLERRRIMLSHKRHIGSVVPKDRVVASYRPEGEFDDYQAHFDGDGAAAAAADVRYDPIYPDQHRIPFDDAERAKVEKDLDDLDEHVADMSLDE